VTINTRKVTGRRRLRFRDYAEAQADIQALRDRPHRPLGNWSLPRIVMHLGEVMHASIDGAQTPVKFPLVAQIAGRLFLRPYLLNVRVPAGIRLPRAAAQQFFFDEAEINAAVERFDSAVVRLGRETNRFVHPLIGRLSPAQWDKFHLRHAEHHLSFLVPE
jgi:hypothetical protein